EHYQEQSENNQIKKFLRVNYCLSPTVFIIKNFRKEIILTDFPNRQLQPEMCVWCSSKVPNQNFYSYSKLPYFYAQSEEFEDVTKKASEISSAHIFDRRKPWHLWAICEDEMADLIDELKMCTCCSAYTSSNPPKFLRCGHLSCGMCITKCTPCKICNEGPRREFKQTITSKTDMKSIVDLDISEMRKCTNCKNLHHTNNFINGKRGETCVYCIVRDYVTEEDFIPTRKRTLPVSHLPINLSTETI
ncbi:hypothetical protein PFISCL1PPCAC_14574, partial [Pristionchus fissidentatus]